MFTKILIANRGEIACRVIKTARRMGIATVAVYSDADANAMHVAEADEAVHIGAAPVGESYLVAENIIAAAEETGAEAIHPGYGFLSENPDFVDAVEAAGLVFIGPSASSIRSMGLKDAAKRLMEKAGVPVVPGYHGEAQELVVLASKAREIGYPVLIKARAGGGGKGMRKVDSPDDFADELSAARREAKAAFGDDKVLVEKYIEKPRHIEVQVFGDNHGNAVHLFERDCSLQRRHQKVIEEAPAPGMTEKMRAAMTGAAVKAAKAISYSGAGTIEFIVDGSKGLRPDGFWFMEMNTRLQVEHPVTEMITGIDLVEWQLRVASGEKLPREQGQIALNGHSFEARIYAEDAARGFLPATGTLHHLRFPDIAETGAEQRIETGVRAGDAISPFYDPMIAKLVVHGADRGSALEALERTLRGTEIAGTVTNIAFLAALAGHGGFAAGDVDTGLIDRNLGDLVAEPQLPQLAPILAAIRASGLADPIAGNDPWVSVRSYSHFNPRTQSVLVGEDDERQRLRIAPDGKGRFIVGAGEDQRRVSLHRSGRLWTVSDGASSLSATVARTPKGVTVFSGGYSFSVAVDDPMNRDFDAVAGGNNLTAPMPGLVKIVSVAPGDSVEKGQALLVMEAMKMEHTLRAPRDAMVAEIRAAEGDQVQEGALLIRFAGDE